MSSLQEASTVSLSYHGMSCADTGRAHLKLYTVCSTSHGMHTLEIKVAVYSADSRSALLEQHVK